MGRRAKYFTLADKRAAAEKRRQENAGLTRERHLRSQQNRRAYIKRLQSCGQAIGTTAVSYPDPPIIPNDLQSLAETQLPATRAFLDACRGDFGDF
ncbi:hypothetical protein BD779DRAFT_1676286 [Infundibulicybe gibba]|nr:hypothetical protein BD779DRAFT_1676286 [Infundibulicybe gibba]